MDVIEKNVQLNKQKGLDRAIDESFIRTMPKDMAALEKKGPAALSAAPPASLPVAEDKPVEKTVEKPVFLPKQPQPIKPIPPVKQVKPDIPKPKAPIEEKPPLKKKKSRLKITFIGLLIIIIIGGAGGVLYWWNYLRPAPVPITTHYQCQDFQCVSVEGEGENECQIDADCQPAEPVIPESLIPITGTKTIEITVGQEGLLLNKLKSTLLEKQATSTLERILVKLVDQQEKEYADLSTLIYALGINLPENISLKEDYTLFSYNQPEGNRLGLIINTEKSFNEETIINDLEPLLLKDETPVPFTENFQDNLYQNIAIRYLNFPGPDLSIDYAIVANRLVITTSRESMYAAINALSGIE